MRRLRELDSPAAGEARLVELVRAAEPTVRSDTHMRRLRAALDEAPPRLTWRMRWSASVAMLLLLLTGVAVASVTSGVVWIQRQRAASKVAKLEAVRRSEGIRPSPLLGALSTTMPTATPLPAPVASREAGATGDSKQDREIRVSTSAPVIEARPTMPRTWAHATVDPGPSRRATPSARAATDVAGRSGPATPENDSLRGVRVVSSAVTAMRRSHEPKVASELLEQYLKEEPHGPLAEEALGLAIEAAAEGDEPDRAASRARRYLDLYPDGRFVSVAGRALRRFSATGDGARAPTE